MGWKNASLPWAGKTPAFHTREMISPDAAALLIVLLTIAAMVTNAFALKYATNHFYVDKVSVVLIPVCALLAMAQL